MCADDDEDFYKSNNNNSIYKCNNWQKEQEHQQQQHHHNLKQQQKQLNKKQVIKTSATAQKSEFKWKRIISVIILLLCHTSHVLAIRKGRLMSPSSFTALSGDLHVQIHFSGEDVAGMGMGIYNESTTIRTTKTAKSTTTPKPTIKLTQQTKVNSIFESTTEPHLTTTAQNKNHNGNKNGTVISHIPASTSSSTSSFTVSHNLENVITSTLVISKFIDETEATEADTNQQQPDNEGVTFTMATNTEERREQLLHRKRKEIVKNIPVFPDPRHNVTQVAIPCQTFLKGGLYEMQVITNLKTTSMLVEQNTSTTLAAIPPTMTTTTLMPTSDERLRQTLDVRWPSAEMIVSPVRLRTYPENPVVVTLRFPNVNCDSAWKSANLPEFWLELVYCGKERTCSQLMPQNISKSSILYAEQVRGYPKQKTVKLDCSLFGLAGNYAVQLRPMVPAPNVPITRRFLSVDWSDKYVFNVYARSIFPCDPHTGIGVLYEYPACILEQGDRVRVYSKLRADVASLKPPTTLHYVAEQRVVKSQYSLYFNCELFTEKYVEYCFVYVTQAVSGAVADVRMDCVPTLPVSDSDTGGWGPWSEWTPCSTNCLGGTRNRYRFCDSPPPRYGAKFCEGSSVQTEKCGKAIADSWDCIYESTGKAYIGENRTEVHQEIGPGCRCGCIVHLGSSKPKRIIAGATQSCPGRSFWLLQVDGEELIALSLNFLRLPCPTQYIKVRDGPSLSSTLLIELNGGSNLNLPVQMESTGAQLLVEFYAGDGNGDGAVPATKQHNSTSKNVASTVPAPRPAVGGHNSNDDDDDVAGNGAASNINTAACTGGFLANVEQIAKNSTTATRTEGGSRGESGTGVGTTMYAATRLSVKSRAVVQKQKQRSGFTLVHLSAVVFASIIILISAMLGAQYIFRYRKYHLAVARRRDEGSRLHTPCASMTSLHSPPSRAVSTTTLLSEVIYLVKMRPKHQLRHSILRESVDAENLARETDLDESVSLHAQLSKCEGERGSNGSIVTLRNEITSQDKNVLSGRSASLAGEIISEADAVEVTGDDAADRNSKSSGTLTHQCGSSKDAESIISSGMSSIYNSPPMNAKRMSKYSDRYDAATLKIRNSHLDDSNNDCDSLRSSCMRDYERLSYLGARSASASLTNGYYSPAASSGVSTAAIRVTNPKESKEKQNRRKLLARPGSEFSLGNQEDLELDYYDYNVINAGAAPGSYLGMDPAYLIWIPPFDEVPDDANERDEDKTPEPAQEPDETMPLYQEIKMPKYGHYLSPGSNTESSTTATTADTTPTSDELSPLNSHRNLQTQAIISPSDTRNLRNSLIQQTLSAQDVKKSSSKPPTPYLTRKQRRQGKQHAKSTPSLDKGGGRESIQLLEFNCSKNMSTSNISESGSDAMTGSYIEKETTVVKSPSDLEDFLALEDIQFADESEGEGEGEQATKTVRATKVFKKIRKSGDPRKHLKTSSAILEPSTEVSV